MRRLAGAGTAADRTGAGAGTARPSCSCREDGAAPEVPLRQARSPRSGGSRECDVVLKDEGASRRHAQLRTKDGVTTHHRPRIDERHAGERRNGRVAAARRRRQDHDRHHGAGVPEGVTRGARAWRRPRSHVVAEGITPFALSALKYGLFALLVLFLWRSMRWAVRGLSMEAGVRHAADDRRASARRGEGAPTVPPGLSSVVIHADGAKPRTVPVESDVVGDGSGPRMRAPARRHLRLAAARPDLRQGRPLVRRGPGLDERHVRERPTPRRARPWCNPATGSASAPPSWSSDDEDRGRRGHRHRPGPRGQRGLLPGRTAALRGRRRHGRSQGRRGRVPTGARDDRGTVPAGRRHARPAGAAGQPSRVRTVAGRHRRQRHGHDPHRRACRRAASSGWPTWATAGPTCCEPARSGS